MGVVPHLAPLESTQRGASGCRNYQGRARNKEAQIQWVTEINWPPRAVEEWVHARQPGKKEDASEESKGDVRKTAGKKVPGGALAGDEATAAG